MSLQGKVALITGSSRGIGRAIAIELAQRGADICVNYLRKRSAAEETAEAIRRLGVRAHPVKANVGDAKEVEALVAECSAVLGGVDILVANAASGVLRPALAQDARSWDWAMNVNARSILWAAKAAVPFMETRGWGRIVSISSIGSRRVLKEYSVVGVSKAAIEALTRYLAVELAPKGIIVNAVSPGVVETEALDFFPSKDRIIEVSKERTPAGRLVTVEDVAKLVAFLCSDDAAMIVGQTIVLDGGYEILA